MKRIVTFTANPTIDVSTTVGVVVADHKLRCAAPRFEPGGGGLNVARAIQQLGGDVAAAAYLAGGATGERLRLLLDGAGVAQRPIAIAGWTRENVTVLEEASGHQYRFVMPGPDVRTDEWQCALDALRVLAPASDYLVASGSLPPGVPDDFYADVARIARTSGSAFVLDTSGPALASALKEGVYLMKPSARELAELAGRPIEDDAQLATVASDLVRRGAASIVIVSLGAGGAFVASADWSKRLTAPTVPVKSRVGAGDSMVAGVVLGLARGWSLADATRLGLAAGTAAVMAPGTGLCARADTERLFAAMGPSKAATR